MTSVSEGTRANKEAATERPLILAATDFSETADAAVQWALGLAREHGARLTITHSLSAYLSAPAMPGIDSSASGVEVGRPESALRIEEEVRERLESIAERGRRTGADVSTDLRAGSPKKTILEAAEELGARLIVIGSRGHTRFERLFLGSVAASVARKAVCPVLTIHPGDSETHQEIRTILVPTDFSADAQVAVRAAMRTLRPRKKEESKIIVLHVQDLPIELTALGPMGAPIQHMHDQPDDAEAKLREIAASLEGEGYPVQKLLRQGYPVEVIEEAARELDADLIVMGTSGRSGLERLLLGSVAERVLQHAPCPVLTVRSAEGASLA